jgi:hypothetical protein
MPKSITPSPFTTGQALWLGTHEATPLRYRGLRVEFDRMAGRRYGGGVFVRLVQGPCSGDKLLCAANWIVTSKP